METICWVNGRLLTADEPALSSLDRGFTVGDGVFETMPIIRGEAFALTRHLDRLRRSVAGLQLMMSDDDVAALKAGIKKTLMAFTAKYGESGGRLRITVSAGVGPLGPARVDVPLTITIGAAPNPAIPDDAPIGARCVRSPYVRNERSAVVGLKTISYAENAVALAHARAAGADEALMANTRGELCEGTGSNVLVEIGGELLTPPLDSGCLPGVTRDLVLEWGRTAGLPIREQTLPFAVLDEAAAGRAHLALTSSLRGAQPVINLDGTAVIHGPLMSELAALYTERSKELLDP